MSNILQSKPWAWAAFILVLAVLVFSFPFLQAWWMFIPFFFAFMGAFCHLIATIIARLNAYAARRLDVASAVFGALTVLGIVAVWVIFQFAFA